jgi:hypothetical protein
MNAAPRIVLPLGLTILSDYDPTVKFKTWHPCWLQIPSARGKVWRNTLQAARR